MIETQPTQFLEALLLFNRQEFFECHDVLEELWSDAVGEDKEFYQGLIQAAVALFHFESGNLGGARKLYASSHGYLTPYGAVYRDVDLKTFLSDFRHCFRELLEADPSNGYPSHITLHPERIPMIRFPVERNET